MWANNGIYENNEQTNERGNERMANNVTEQNKQIREPQKYV